jgi:plasmid maintenance system antidote protein VapI
MVIADYHIRRVAQSHHERHGADAIGKARERVRELVRRGDSIGADMWIRIVIVLNDWRARGQAPSSLAE